MKKVFRSIVVALIAFVAVAYFYPGFNYSGDLKTLFLAAVIFAVLNLFVKPAIKIVMLPFNLLTFGFFSFVINVIILYAVSFFIHSFKVVAFHFGGVSISGFNLPALELNVFFSALVSSFIIGGAITILQWVFR